MTTQTGRGPGMAPPTARAEVPVRVPLVALLDVTTKAVLLGLLILVVIDPAWGNLEGKAPIARAVTYPLWSFAVPALWVLRGRRDQYPWLADLLVTTTCFTDVLGNRLDLYDTVSTFDDRVHLVVPALLSGAVVLLTPPATSALVALERTVAVGATAALAGEVFEYVSFVTRSAERATAYADTVNDLVLGWLGTMVGALAVLLWRRQHVGRELERGRT